MPTAHATLLALAAADGGGLFSSPGNWAPLIVVGVVLLLVLVRRLYASSGGGAAGAAGRGYGLAGGAICPRCGKPFARPFWAPNMITGKLCRCPHCGKWSIVAAAGAAELEAAERAASGPSEPPSAPGAGREAELRRRIDESRYE